MSLESPVTETISPAPDYTQIPASAFPEGADPSTYKDSLSAPETPAKPERPAHIPEKFWDAEAGAVRTDDLVKSYAELEAKHRSPKSEDKPADEAAKPNDLTIEPAKDETPAQAEANPVTTAFEAFAKHYEETSGQPAEDQIADTPPPEGAIYRVQGDETGGFMSYYVVRRGGVWEECVKPGLVNAIDPKTMPHALVRDADGSFVFAPFSWAPRRVAGHSSVKITADRYGHIIADDLKGLVKGKQERDAA